MILLETEKKYKIIYADPAWQYSFSGTRNNKEDDGITLVIDKSGTRIVRILNIKNKASQAPEASIIEEEFIDEKDATDSTDVKKVTSIIPNIIELDKDYKDCLAKIEIREHPFYYIREKENYMQTCKNWYAVFKFDKNPKYGMMEVEYI